MPVGRGDTLSSFARIKNPLERFSNHKPERDITRHDVIEILLIQKNAIRQHLKGITLLKINVSPSIF